MQNAECVLILQTRLHKKIRLKSYTYGGMSETSGQYSSFFVVQMKPVFASVVLRSRGNLSSYRSTHKSTVTPTQTFFEIYDRINMFLLSETSQFEKAIRLAHRIESFSRSHTSHLVQNCHDIPAK